MVTSGNGFLHFFKLRTNAKAIQRANKSDAGLDAFYCPDFNSKTFGIEKKTDDTYVAEDTGNILVRPGGSVLVPTGLKVVFPHGFMLQVCNKGSIGSKGLVHGAHIIDAGYTGEVFLDMHNISEESVLIEPGQKVAQLILTPISVCEPTECNTEREYNALVKQCTFSDRGEGKLGSTGK